MRIRELVERCGLPKTTIHFYQRDGLLPPPLKTARNAALYNEEHVARLVLIGELRKAGLPVPQLRRAIDLIEQGVEQEVALALQRVLVSAPATLSMQDIAEAADMPVERARQLHQAGLLGAPEREWFHQDDVAALEAIKHMCDVGAGVALLQQTAIQLQALTRAEFVVADKITAAMPAAQRSATLLGLQYAVDRLHHYWLSEARKHEVFQRWPAALQTLIKEQTT